MDAPPSYSESTAPPSYSESQANYSSSNAQPIAAQFPPPAPRPNLEQDFLIVNDIQNASLRQVVIVQPKPEIITDRRLLEPPSDLSCYAFLACTFCCLFTGVIALAHTDEVQRHQQNGDIIQANKANRIVRRLIIVSVVLGCCLYLFGIIMGIVVAT